MWESAISVLDMDRLLDGLLGLRVRASSAKGVKTVEAKEDQQKTTMITPANEHLSQK